ncbi:MAG: hypothetical protein RBR01_04290 [Desulfobacterales bacterium]|nr:hypothetical protein [Desulfobacterales bacterium]MDD3080640.1 hypothetical protein [Desulfobacterales bacterium]MDD3949647.1 hypothetical protein [Desulfobacterales bacterium]MDD4463001.1 hypothetical protein [Desulfobacterales bacterium]MDY0377637.1 hypothetical protein [Desulfobacterales bacterium]
MSAILKALKKLEDQTTDGFAAARSGAQMTPERVPWHAVRKAPWNGPGFRAVVIAAFGLLAAGGIWIYKTLPVKPEPVVSPYSELQSGEGLERAAQPARTPQRRLPGPEDDPAPRVPSQNDFTVLAQARSPIQKIPSKPFLSNSKPQVRPGLNAPAAVQTAQDAPVVHDDSPPSMPNRSADNSAPTSSAPAVLKNPPYRIQAIAWAEDPLRRIVVIDGNILHEGETVNDCFIQNIHPDAIEIRQGGKLWTIEFRIN